MLALAQAVHAAPEVDAQRVAQLQQSIGNGTYQVQPERIANQLLKMEQDLAAAR
jgi:flagellar biosynthesis anti-sigma factor FlgM